MSAEQKGNLSSSASKPKGFSQFASRIALIVGSSWIFVAACAGVLIWGVTGPLFHFSDTWQLVINTATTIITFLMVFLIQNTQNRDARAIHLKLDEIIRAHAHAHNDMINIEKMSDEELEGLTAQYQKIREEYDHRAAARVLRNAKEKLPSGQ